MANNRFDVLAAPNIGGVTDVWGPWQTADSALFTGPDQTATIKLDFSSISDAPSAFMVEYRYFLEGQLVIRKEPIVGSGSIEFVAGGDEFGSAIQPAFRLQSLSLTQIVTVDPGEFVYVPREPSSSYLPPVDTTPPDNSMLDNETNLNEETTDESTENGETDFENGDAREGSTMPIDVINGDGANNTIASEIVTDGLRPGNFELSDTGITRDIAYENLVPQYTQNPDLLTFAEPLDITVQETLFANDHVGIWSATNLTGISVAAPKLINIDPVVLDMDGDGIELINFRNSVAFFDVDNDGFIENTG